LTGEANGHATRTEYATTINSAQRGKTLNLSRPERPLGCADMEAMSVRGFAVVIADEAAFEGW